MQRTVCSHLYSTLSTVCTQCTPLSRFTGVLALYFITFIRHAYCRMSSQNSVSLSLFSDLHGAFYENVSWRTAGNKFLQNFSDRFPHFDVQCSCDGSKKFLLSFLVIFLPNSAGLKKCATVYILCSLNPPLAYLCRSLSLSLKFIFLWNGFIFAEYKMFHVLKGPCHKSRRLTSLCSVSGILCFTLRGSTDITVNIN